MDEEESVSLKFAGMKNALTRWVGENVYPIVIFIASLIVLVVVPMIGSKAEAGSAIPEDPDEAFLYWTLKVLTSGLNLAIFQAFRSQAKVKSKNNPNFKEAEHIMGNLKVREYKPVSPRQFATKQWATKGSTLLLSTAVASIALTNIVLYYNWTTFISCAVTIAIAIIFGLMTLASEEYYWTVDYLKYAKSVKGEQDGNNH